MEEHIDHEMATGGFVGHNGVYVSGLSCWLLARKKRKLKNKAITRSLSYMSHSLNSLFI